METTYDQAHAEAMGDYDRLYVEDSPEREADRDEARRSTPRFDTRRGAQANVGWDLEPF